MSKKLLALGLACAMAFSLLAGCGGGGTQDGGGAGKVYYLNFKPEADDFWQELAKAYTAETGVEVKVVTAASGQYETELKSEMAKSEAQPCSRSTAPWAWPPGRTTATTCPDPRSPVSCPARTSP